MIAPIEFLAIGLPNLLWYKPYDHMYTTENISPMNACGTVPYAAYIASYIQKHNAHALHVAAR